MAYVVGYSTVIFDSEDDIPSEEPDALPILEKSMVVFDTEADLSEPKSGRDRFLSTKKSQTITTSSNTTPKTVKKLPNDSFRRKPTSELENQVFSSIPKNFFSPLEEKQIRDAIHISDYVNDTIGSPDREGGLFIEEDDEEDFLEYFVPIPKPQGGPVVKGPEGAKRKKETKPTIFHAMIPGNPFDVEDESESSGEEEFILFGKYLDGNIHKCTPIEISPDATLNELRNSFTDATGKKVKKMSTTSNPDEFITGDHIPISAWPDITNGSFINIYI